MWLHGWSAEISVWGEFPDLAGREAILFDLPGHGKSPLAKGLAFPDIARTILDTIPGPADFVGWSLGGILALQCALMEPAKVRSLAILAISNFGGERAIRMRAALDRDKLKAMGDFYRAVWSDADRRRPGFASLQVKLAMNRHLPAIDTLVEIYEVFGAGIGGMDLGRVACPVVIIQGTADAIAPLSRAREVTAMIPGARLAPIEGAGHAPFLTFPDECHDLLKRFWAAPRGTFGSST